MSLSAKKRKNLKSHNRSRPMRDDERRKKQVATGSALKACVHQHIIQTRQTANIIKTDFQRRRTQWTGRREGWDKKEYSLQEALNHPDLTLLPWSGQETKIIQGDDGLPLIIMGKRQDNMDALIKRIDEKLTKAQKDLNFVPLKRKPNVRGTGSFGGGQTRPAMFAHTPHNDEIVEGLRKDEDILRIAGLCDATVNFLFAVTRRHKDFLNMIYGFCAVTPLGPYNYKQGGHLIIWDLGLIIEFPREPSSFSLPLSLSIRMSASFLARLGLFRWRHNGYMSDKEFRARASPKVLKKWKQYRRGNVERSLLYHYDSMHAARSQLAFMLKVNKIPIPLPSIVIPVLRNLAAKYTGKYSLNLSFCRLLVTPTFSLKTAPHMAMVTHTCKFELGESSCFIGNPAEVSSPRNSKSTRVYSWTIVSIPVSHMPRPQPTANYYRPPSFHPYPASSPSLTPRLTSTPNPIFPPPPSSQRPQQSHSLYPTPSRSHTPHSLPAPTAVRYPVRNIPRSSVSSPPVHQEKRFLSSGTRLWSRTLRTAHISKPAQVSSESNSGASPTAGRKDMLSSSHEPLPSRFLSDIGNQLQGSSRAASHSEAQCSADSPVGLGSESAARSPVFPISGEIQPEPAPQPRPSGNDDRSNAAHTAAFSSHLPHRPRMGQEEKILKARTTDKQLANVIAKICDSLETQMDQVQREYRVPLARVRKMVGLHWSQRAGNLMKGYKHQAPEIHQALQEDDDMMKEIEDPESKVVEKWRQEMKDSKEDKFVGTRGLVGLSVGRSSRSQYNFHPDGESFQTYWSVHLRMMCKGDFSTSITPAFWGIGPMEDFLMDTFKMSGFDFVNAAQSYACLAALKGKGMTNDQMKESIASMISRGIQELFCLCLLLLCAYH
ncbi:hypothetical protein DFJ43DRAFT_1044529 [Lentinula guzmanii]|uniref:Uncharacterized protein n=1 Tax=Lentinula guzmanii TaxID=2804957 RepID=A0AA38MUF2_9AGAR|nr:hypothetical protein DFJ43DRAFT_1044529 [Lentinula guzmanii]